MPAMIDDQVHFRDPGLTHKGDLATESRAAVAGGIASFMEMPNTNPQTVTSEALEAKYAHAAERAVGNHAFYLGATNDNLAEIQRLDPNAACGVKVFMGASTGNMLVDREEALDGIFRDAPCLIATHCEDTPMIKANEEAFRAKYGELAWVTATPPGERCASTRPYIAVLYRRASPSSWGSGRPCTWKNTPVTFGSNDWCN